MRQRSANLPRRQFLLGLGAGAALLPISGAGQSLLPGSREIVSVADFGAVSSPGVDNSIAIQKAVDAVQARGGGVVLISEVYECGNIVVSGDGVTFHGPGAWLVNGRITVLAGRQECRIAGLGLLDNRGDDSTYLLDISGGNCTFEDVSLVKDPIAGGYQMYMRQEAEHCTFTGLRTRGSNGIFIAGHDHVFSDFELESTLDPRMGGDDAFVVKAPGGQTYNIAIRDGIVRGHSALLSIGSEVGTSERDSRYTSYVRNVSVDNVAGEKCASLVYIKPGALIYDYRFGLVEDVRLTNVRLDDPTGFLFASGFCLTAGRGAIIRGVTGRNLMVRARARSQGMLATSAIDLNIIPDGAPAAIEDIDVELAFTDPYEGAPHGPAAPGYPVDHVARVEKRNPSHGRMENIVLDVTGNAARIGGIYVGAGLDGAVRVKRAHLQKMAINPPAQAGSGGIWSDSKIILQDIQVEAVSNKTFGGSGLAGR